MDVSPSPSPRRLAPHVSSGNRPVRLSHDDDKSPSRSFPYRQETHRADAPRQLYPVQEYHNAFADADDGRRVQASTVTTSMPSTPSSPTKKTAAAQTLASFSSASRAFFEHRRQQSIPNLLPSLASSLGQSVGRAMSPDRSTRSPRLPIPAEYRRGPDDSKNRSVSSDRSERSDSRDDSNDSNDSDDSDNSDSSDNDDDYSAYIGRRNMSPFSRRRGTTFTTYTGGRRRNSHRNSNSTNESSSHSSTPGSPSTKAGLAGWLGRPGGNVGGNGGANGSGNGSGNGTRPNRASEAFTPSTARAATPEPSGQAWSTSQSPARGTPSTSPSRFSQLATSMTATLSRLTQPPPPSQLQSPRLPSHAALSNDELYHLDVEATLFPGGMPSEHDDGISPAALTTIAANVVNLAQRLQTAYRERTVDVCDLVADKSARDEALEESATRVQHLKRQLEDMARQAAEQQRAMQALADELVAEKMASAREHTTLPGIATTGGDGGGSGDGSGVYCNTNHKDGEAPTPPQAAHPRVAALGTPPPPQALAKFQKLVHNVTAALKDEDPFDRNNGSGGGASCRNCRGQDVSFAWNTVSVLRDENANLKLRVGQMEAAVEGALDMVNGIGL